MKPVPLELTDELVTILDAIATASRGATIEELLRDHPDVEAKRAELGITFVDRRGAGRPWPKKRKASKPGKS